MASFKQPILATLKRDPLHQRLGEEIPKRSNRNNPATTARHQITPRIRITIHAAPPDNRKRDLDNLPKAVFDALTSAGFWLDDGQIDDMRIKRYQAIKGGMLVLVVTETCGSLPMITELLEAA